MNMQPERRAASLAPLCLTDAEVSQLTGKTRPSAQLRAWRYMAIDHKRRPDGSIVVLRSIFAQALTAPTSGGIPE